MGRPSRLSTPSGVAHGFAWVLFVALCTALPAPAARALQLGLRIPVVSQTEQMEWDLLAALNRERSAANLPPLTLSPPITRLSRAHSSEMSARNTLSYESPAGPYTERLMSASVPFLASAENVGQSLAANVDRIHRALLDREGQRANILNPAFDEVGIGVVRGVDSFFVTEDFIESLVRTPLDVVRDGILRALNDARAANRQPAVVPRDDVDMAADAVASDLASGEPVETPTFFGSTRMRTVKGQDLEALVPAILGDDRDPSARVGLGVVFRQTDEYPGGAYFICALFVSGG